MIQYGINNMLDFSSLPLLKSGVKVQYEGSIDKKGLNADWDWWLYKEAKEWVIFDVEGPGCIYNFVQHRYPTSEEPVFRFYFDGEDKPRFEIKHSEFGYKFPFVEPLAGQYIGPEDNGRGPIRVIRSFVPMPYKKSCKITSSLRLKGCHKDKKDGGWGHVMYHSYSMADGVETYTGQEDYTSLLEMWSHVGKDPKSDTKNRKLSIDNVAIKPDSQIVLFDKKGTGSIAAIKARINEFNPIHLHSLWISASWDNHETSDILCPIGVFFGNELGYNSLQVLSHGMTKDGSMYNYFPMPYWETAKIELLNKGNTVVTLSNIEVQWNESDVGIYQRENTGYFRSSKYYTRKATKDSDSIIADIKGKGHLVAGHITAFAKTHGVISCEGDVRVHIDGIATPQVESDGSESWVNYGWGFPTPAEMNPSSGYDGLPDNPWSMVRLCTGDWYPFQTGLRFGIESGEFNNQYLEHSGIIFYYGIDNPGLLLSDELDIGNEVSEQLHEYKIEGERSSGKLSAYYEGDDDGMLIEDFGREFEEYSEFKVNISQLNDGIRLRRRSDQFTGRQRAKVFVDGTEVKERNWYFADRNPYKRWLEDEFEIPAAYTSGKSSITIRIEYVQDGETRAWNEYYYWVYSYVK